MIPIDKNSNDPFYRYTMPEILTAHETSKTALQNLDKVAKSLSRNPLHILKFLSMSFGCTSTSGPKYALNGNFSQERIQEGIYDFIGLFVLCNECDSPETQFLTGEPLKRSCNSCGAIFLQKSHKLNMAISKDRNVNKDTKYETTSKRGINALIKESEDNSGKIHEICQQEGLEEEDVFSEYVKPSELKQLRIVLKEFNGEKVLECIENMLEMHKKEGKMDEYLQVLVDLDVSKESLLEYAGKARTKKKRSGIVKKIFEEFVEDA